MLFRSRQTLIRAVARAFGHDAPQSQIDCPPNVEIYKVLNKPYRGIYAYGCQPTRPPTEGGRILETTWVKESTQDIKKLSKSEHSH